MKITLEQIDMIRKRTNAGYKEAKEALEYAQGDIVGALAYLDEQGKARKDKFRAEGCGIMGTIKKWIQRGKELRIVVNKDGKDYLRISVLAAVIAGFLLNFLITPVLILAVLAVLTGYKIYIEDNAGLHGIEIFRPQAKEQSAAPVSPADGIREVKETDFTEI